MSSPPAAATSAHIVRVDGHPPSGWHRCRIPAVGTRSTTGLNSTGCPPYVLPCGWCRRRPAVTARAASTSRCDAIDHVMTYFFSRPRRTEGIHTNSPRRSATRTASCLYYPRCDAGSTQCGARQPRASSQGRCRRAAAGGRPAACYLLLETGASAPPTHLVDVDGVAGVWSATSQSGRRELGERPCGPDDLVLLPRRRPGSHRETTCARSSEKRWNDQGRRTALRAPFHTVVPHEWDRYVP